MELSKKLFFSDMDSTFPLRLPIKLNKIFEGWGVFGEIPSEERRKDYYCSGNMSRGFGVLSGNVFANSIFWNVMQYIAFVSCHIM